MSAIASLEELATMLEAHFDDLNLEEADDANLVQWFISHIFNSLIPATANLRNYLEGKTPDLTLLKAYYQLSNPPAEVVISGKPGE